MRFWNSLDGEALKWAEKHTNPRLMLNRAEIGFRIKGKRPKKIPSPGQISFIAGDGTFGFKGKRYKHDGECSMTTVKLHGDQFDKRSKTVFGFRRKRAGGMMMRLPQRLVDGIDPVIDAESTRKAKLARKGPRRRTKKKQEKKMGRTMLDRAIVELIDAHKHMR